MTGGLTRANRLAFALPAALLAGAWGSQLFGGLFPCEMCHWQRWPHYTALGLAALAFALPSQRKALVILAGLAIITSGAIGVFHAGVEYHWWEGITTCSTTASTNTLDAILHAPVIRCDVAQWTLFGISLAGFNAIISTLGGVAVLAMARKG